MNHVPMACVTTDMDATLREESDAVFQKEKARNDWAKFGFPNQKTQCEQPMKSLTCGCLGLRSSLGT